ncbi:hypothetical protein SpAB1_17620 [Streptococcus pyogenes]|nr:hypothetical protein SpAB1_17620 [Streptococcus pyogenes]
MNGHITRQFAYTCVAFINELQFSGMYTRTNLLGNVHTKNILQSDNVSIIVNEARIYTIPFCLKPQG